MKNILLETFQTPFQTVAFEQIKNSDFLPAFKILIEKSLYELEKISTNPEEPSFINTIEALAFSGEQLEVVSQIFFNLNSAETSEEIQQIAQEISPILTEYISEISQNKKLFRRIKTVYDQKKNLDINDEEQTLLNETYKNFIKNGANLSDEDKNILKEINTELSKKQLQFGQNLLSATNAYTKHITDKEDLLGIPEDIINQYAEEAKKRNLPGWVVTLQYPSYMPFITYCKNRKLREELFLANGRKSFDGGEFDNQNLIKKIVELRDRKAKILGYNDFASFVLEDRMAKSPQIVEKFILDLFEKAKLHAQKEIQELKKIGEEDGIMELYGFDHAFYAEKLKKQKYDLSDEEIKPYFPLERVQEAIFSLAEKLFGLKFEERNDIQKYHREVKIYEVKEKNIHKAILYLDYFPRSGKRAGAWMTSYRKQYKKNNKNIRPHISIVCNFSRPNGDIPSLLTFQEVTTLFHEFGHALHGILADTKYPSLSGTSVKWDFVELPSQFLENFCYEIDFLKTFAKHYKTGEILSEEKIKKIAESKNFMEGYQTLRQLGLGLLDLAYHTRSTDLGDIKTFEDMYTKITQLYPIHSETAISPSFSHIFQGGYASGYYSYKWAEVLDADAFALFKETGIFNQKTSDKYKIMLSLGGTIDPMELYKSFRGSEPKTEYLIKRAFG